MGAVVVDLRRQTVSTHPDVRLSQRLRAETGDAHRAAERAFALDRRLTSLAHYGDLLQILDAFAVTSAPALQALAGGLPAGLCDGPARRRRRLRGDLARLGRAGASSSPPSIAVAVDLDDALGAWYVHEGAALGGLVIAAQVRRRLPAAASATRFFAGEGPRTAARWRSVRAVLDGWPTSDGDRVVAGGRATFERLTALLMEAGP